MCHPTASPPPPPPTQFLGQICTAMDAVLRQRFALSLLRCSVQVRGAEWEEVLRWSRCCDEAGREARSKTRPNEGPCHQEISCL